MVLTSSAEPPPRRRPRSPNCFPASVVLGLTIGLAGTDVTTGAHRLTFGLLELYDGVNIIAVSMGMFGLS
ncbi:MAG: tripartite tricarboxylate transporter permease, partial [Pseudomonadota bacterium]|nr:tripartite tricarboxylate transporter permease [Pseudomonadota bacterium]